MITSSDDGPEYLITKLARKSHKFSDNLYEHGFYRNNTLDEETNRKKRDEKRKLLHNAKMDKMSNQFRREMREITVIQNKLQKMQRKEAEVALRLCAAIIIQSQFRGFRWRRFYQTLMRERMVNFIQLWYWFRTYYAQRTKATKVIQVKYLSVMHEYTYHLVLRASMAANCAAEKERQTS